MEASKKRQGSLWWSTHPEWLLVLVLVAVLGVLFARSFLPDYVLFSNDGPLGVMAGYEQEKWSNFQGNWTDLNSIGTQSVGSNLSISQAILLSLSTLAWAKFFAPLTLLILGLAAGFFFRRLGLSNLASVLGALAAALNCGFFTAACWGVGTQEICVACCFLAMGLLVREEEPFHWVRVALAGLAVGMGIMEAFDIGALFSICVAIFLVVQPWMTPGPVGRRVVRHLGRLAVVVCFAALIAFQTVLSLISTQIQGVAGTQQDARSKEERWDFATQWSLPKVETLSFLVPGLFGYRMDTPEGGNYWGAIGRDPAWDRYFAGGGQGAPPARIMRFSGGGGYEGVLVLLVAAWAIAQSLRKDKSVFSPAHRKAIWFWSGLGFVSLLLAFGRFAPFYQVLYALPYFSTIRNPAKFTYFVGLSTVILFAYGAHGLCRAYLCLEGPRSAGRGLVSSLQAWWSRARGFDRRWTVGCVLFLGLNTLGWLLYATSSASMEAYLQTVQFDAETAKAIAGFSIRQVGWYVLLLAVAVGLLTVVLSGFLSGTRARWAGVLLGGFLVVDLGRTNAPYIVYWDWQQKYATNGVIEFLRQKPYEQRVAILPQSSLLGDLYRMEWAQHVLLYYKVPSLDIVQMPRMPEDLKTFDETMGKAGPLGIRRRWELTSTRYLLGPANFAGGLNQQLDPQLQRFSNLLEFNIVPKPGIGAPHKLEELTAVIATNGQYAVVDFAGAQPRAGLYSQWITATNDEKALETLVSPAFHPAQTVLVATNLPAAPAGTTNQSAGTVAFVSYSPKDLVLKADARQPAVLLLNDKYDPNWQVLVDGHPAPLLRCNFIMRGVSLAPGPHTVEFHFRPPYRGLYVSLAGVALGVALCGFLALYPRKQPTADVKG